MRPTSVSRSAAGTSAWIPVDYRQNPFNIGLGLVISGTLTADVEHTFDDVFDSSVTPTAFKHDTMTGKSANDDGNYAFPIRAIRLNLTAYTSGSATLTILQGQR